MGEAVSQSFWADKRVLITGHSGFLGGRMVDVLYDLGAAVFGLDYQTVYQWPYDSEWLERRGKLEGAFMGDVRDYATVERLITEWKPDCIFHLAAITQVVDAKLMPLQTYQTNILGTANILQAVMQSDLTRAVVVASSDKAYGRPAEFPVNEYTRLNPFHPYDVSKAAADLIARSYYDTYGLPVAVTRCGNIYGPEDRNWQRIVPSVIRWLLRGERPIIRSDGSHLREYNYIDDIIEAYLLVGEYTIMNGGGWAAWTISDPKGYLSVIDVAETIASQLGVPLNAKILGGALKEERKIQLDSSMIRNRLGWEPLISIDEGIRRTIEWAKVELQIPS